MLKVRVVLLDLWKWNWKKGNKEWLSPAGLSSKAGALFDCKPSDKDSLVCLPSRSLSCCEGRENGQGSVFCVTLRKKGQFMGFRQGPVPRCACRPASAMVEFHHKQRRLEAQSTAHHSPTASLCREKNKEGLLCPELVGPQHPARRYRLQKTKPQSLSPEANRGRCSHQGQSYMAAAPKRATEDLKQGWSTVRCLGG